MPKGKKKDPDNLPAFKLTTFHIPPQVNTKNMSSAYQKQESQASWTRRTATQGEKRKRDAAEAEAAYMPGVPSGSQTIVIHPGSETLRIGRATDYAPKEVPMAIARRRRSPRTASASGTNGSGAGGSEKGKEREQQDFDAMDVDGAEASDEVAEQIASLRSVLQQRTAALQLRSFPAGPSLVSSYNSDVRPSKIKDFNDPFRVEWLGPDAPALVFGESLDLVPGEDEWEVSRPIADRRFSASYANEASAVGDLQIILEWALKELLNIKLTDLSEYSVILIIPDSAPHAYLRAFACLLLSTMGFGQLSIQQESLGASFGAGLSAACVVDVGATATTVACVEDGVVLADTRQTLAYGGADLTAWFATLLKRSDFPYADLDVKDAMDFRLIQGLKEQLSTLNEQQVGVNVHDFWVRRPGKETLKFDFKIFDDSILCPMGLFDPRVLDLETKLVEKARTGRAPSTEDDGETGFVLDQPSAAMMLSTAHLRPAPPVAPPAPSLAPSAPASDAGLLTPQPEGVPAASVELALSASQSSRPSSSASPEKGTPGLPAAASQPATGTDTPALALAADAAPAVPDAPPIDVWHEASKTALDEAVCHALASAATEDKVRKFASTVLVVGGGALVRGFADGLASRVQPLLSARFPALAGAVSVVPPPREVDPRLLVWKGISVLARLESVHETWVARDEWDIAGMRAVKDRAFFL